MHAWINKFRADLQRMEKEGRLTHKPSFEWALEHIRKIIGTIKDKAILEYPESFPFIILFSEFLETAMDQKDLKKLFYFA